MKSLGTRLLLLIALCSGFQEPYYVYQIVPLGDIWLGESVKLVIKMPNMQRPTVWRVNNFRYECHLTCANGSNYQVTHDGNISTLWISNVSWKVSDWTFEDGNLRYAGIRLDIKVKPKIEITNTTTEYKLMANCSSPPTVIKCQQEKLLEFTKYIQSNCSDGRTFRTVATLNRSQLSGRAICWFSIGKIFNKSRQLKFESQAHPRRKFTDAPIAVWISIGSLILTIIWGLFLYNKVESKRKILKRGNGKDSLSRNLNCEYVLRILYFWFLNAAFFAVAFECQKRMEIPERPEHVEAPLISLCTIALVLGIFSILLVFGWILASYQLYKMTRQMTTTKGEDSRSKNHSYVTMFLCAPSLEIVALCFDCWYTCSKCEKGAECTSGLFVATIVLLCLLLILWFVLTADLYEMFEKPNEKPLHKRAKDIPRFFCSVIVRLIIKVCQRVTGGFAFITSRLEDLYDKIFHKKETENQTENESIPFSTDVPGSLQ